MNEGRPILQLHQVTRQYSRHAHPAVCSISLSLCCGDLLALLGPSGCGKTTLLRLIAGFETPQDGTIAITERPVAGNGQWVPPERRGVGMVFQDYALFPHLTVRQNIEFGLGNRAHSASRVKDVLAIVRLVGLENRYPHQLSGGQQQRVALARAIAPNPSLILLDEPLSNLDVQVRLQLRQELRAILKAAGASAIFVTHDQEEALSIADQVAVMCQGRLEQIGTPEQLYQQPASRFVAEFVTQANLIPAQRQGKVWQTEIGAIAIGSDQFSSLPDQSDLMLRQEDLVLTPDPHSSITIIDRQFLGREYSYGLQLPSGRTIIARTPVTTCLEMNTSVQVAIAAEKVRSYSRS
jgi:iron(III) transport system ATP-binding protein